MAHTPRRSQERVASAPSTSGVARKSTAAMRPSRSFQMAPSRMKWCTFTAVATSIATAAVDERGPSRSGEKSSTGTVQIAIPATAALAKYSAGPRHLADARA